MKLNKKILVPVVSAVVSAALMAVLQHGCGDSTGGSTGSLVPPPLPPDTVLVRDSISVDSMKAVIRAEVRPEVMAEVRAQSRLNVQLAQGKETPVDQAVIDSAFAEDSTELLEAALVEAHEVIGDMQSRIDSSELISDIVAEHDTVVHNEDMDHKLFIKQTFSQSTQMFGLDIVYEMILVEETWLEKLLRWTPYIVGILGTLALTYNQIKPN